MKKSTLKTMILNIDTREKQLYKIDGYIYDNNIFVQVKGKTKILFDMPTGLMICELKNTKIDELKQKWEESVFYSRYNNLKETKKELYEKMKQNYQKLVEA